MKKSLSKAIMVRTRLKNIFLKNRTEENKTNYNKQRNDLNLSVENICYNKKFWKLVKPLLSNKIISSEMINLVDGTKI